MRKHKVARVGIVAGAGNAVQAAANAAGEHGAGTVPIPGPIPGKANEGECGGNTLYSG